MSKFTKKFKMNVVSDYFKMNLGSKFLCHKYHVRSHSTIDKWISLYRAYGLEGLVVRSPTRVYSGDYKVKVLNWRHSHHESYTRTALHFNLINPATICAWERRMEAQGIVGLYTQRGPHKMKKEQLESKFKNLQKRNLTLAVKYGNERLKPKYSKFKRAEMLNHKIPKLSLVKLLKILRIPRSTYYYHQRTTQLSAKKDEYILQQIEDIKSKPHQHNLGYRPVTAHLQARLNKYGVQINHKHVLRIMKANHLTSTVYCRKKRKYNSYKGPVGNIAPNRLKRNFHADHPYQKLTTDVSEFRYGNEDIRHRVYLSPVMDLYSDKILSYTISKHPTVEFTLRSLRGALNTCPKGLSRKTIVHSDQGFQYQNIRWQMTLKHYDALQSMSRKGTCLDNSQMESFFHIMKDEMMNIHYQTVGQLINAMKSWIYYYNHDRIKEKLNWKSPNQYQQLAV